MEAILKFNLPEENDNFEIAVKAQSLHSALWEFNQFLHGELKHNYKLTPKEYKLAESYQSKFIEILNENNITLF
jgi:hypothetical protein